MLIKDPTCLNIDSIPTPMQCVHTVLKHAQTRFNPRAPVLLRLFRGCYYDYISNTQLHVNTYVCNGKGSLINREAFKDITGYSRWHHCEYL